MRYCSSNYSGIDGGKSPTEDSGHVIILCDDRIRKIHKRKIGRKQKWRKCLIVSCISNQPSTGGLQVSLQTQARDDSYAPIFRIRRLIVPALASGENDVEDRLRCDKSQSSGGSSNTAADKVRRAIRDTNNVDQKVLVREVGGIGSDKESGGATDDGT